MNVAHFEEAYATLLVSDDARVMLVTQPEVIGRRFSLSDAELAVLRSLDRARLDLCADTVKGVRVRVLQRALPATTRALADCPTGDEVLDFYLRRYPPFREASHNRLLAEAARFVRFAGGDGRDHVPPPIRDVATYEELRLRLAYDSRAGEAALACQGQAVEWLGKLLADAASVTGITFALGTHVALAAFDYDVVAITSDGGSQPLDHHRRRTRLVLNRSHGRMVPLTYRVGAVTYELFRRFDGTTSFGQICSEVFEGGPTEAATQTVQMGLEHRLLVVPSSRHHDQS